MKNSWMLWVLVLILVAPSCSSKKKADEIGEGLEDRLTDAMNFEGGTKHEGAPPTGSDDPSAPQIDEVTGGDLRLGAPFSYELESTFRSPQEVNAAIVYVENATSYWVVQGALEIGIMDLVGRMNIVDDLLGQSFNIKFALQTAGGVTGSYRSTRSTILNQSAQSIPHGQEIAAVIASGEVYHDSGRPEGRSGSDVPQIIRVIGPHSLLPGESFVVTLQTDFEGVVLAALLTTPGNVAYKEIPADLADGRVTVIGMLASEGLSLGDRLVFQWALKGESGSGIYRSWPVVVEEHETTDGDADPDEETTPEGDTEPPDGDLEPGEADPDPSESDLEESDIEDACSGSCMSDTDASFCLPGVEILCFCNEGQWMRLNCVQTCESDAAVCDTHPIHGDACFCDPPDGDADTSDPDAEMEPEADPDTEMEPEADPDAEPEADPDAEMEPEADPEPTVGRLEGRVILGTAFDMLPISGATVQVQVPGKTDFSATSGTDGAYAIEGITPAEELTVWVFAPSNDEEQIYFAPAIEKVDVVAGKTTLFNPRVMEYCKASTSNDEPGVSRTKSAMASVYITNDCPWFNDHYVSLTLPSLSGHTVFEGDGYLAKFKIDQFALNRQAPELVFIAPGNLQALSVDKEGTPMLDVAFSAVTWFGARGGAEFDTQLNFTEDYALAGLGELMILANNAINPTNVYKFDEAMGVWRDTSFVPELSDGAVITHVDGPGWFAVGSPIGLGTKCVSGRVMKYGDPVANAEVRVYADSFFWGKILFTDAEGNFEIALPDDYPDDYHFDATAWESGGFRYAASQVLNTAATSFVWPETGCYNLEELWIGSQLPRCYDVLTSMDGATINQPLSLFEYDPASGFTKFRMRVPTQELPVGGTGSEMCAQIPNRDADLRWRYYYTPLDTACFYMKEKPWSVTADDVTEPATCEEGTCSSESLSFYCYGC